MGHHHLNRLARARDLLAEKGYDTSETILTCYGGSGFTTELQADATQESRIRLINVNDLYESR
jgi:hypothetical protein